MFERDKRVYIFRIIKIITNVNWLNWLCICIDIGEL